MTNSIPIDSIPHVVMVSDTDISGAWDEANTLDSVEIIGPFPNKDAALAWACMEQRWIVAVKSITFRRPS